MWWCGSERVAAFMVQRHGRLHVLIFSTLLGVAACASTAGPYRVALTEVPAFEQLDSISILLDNSGASGQENERLMSVLLTVALGPFGGHRLYLGTGAKVPIIYALTLGGCFGVLPTIDLIHLLLKKDLEPYRNNKQVFMWAEPPADEPTPP